LFVASESSDCRLGGYTVHRRCIESVNAPANKLKQLAGNYLVGTVSVATK